MFYVFYVIPLRLENTLKLNFIHFRKGIFTASIRSTTKGYVFTYVHLFNIVGEGGVPHLHLIILVPGSLGGGDPSDWSQTPSWGYPSPRYDILIPKIGVPPSQYRTGVPLGQDRIGVLPPPTIRTGLGYPHGQDWYPHSRDRL